MPIRLLVSSTVDYLDDVAVQFNGNAKVYEPVLLIIDITAENCVNEKNAWILESI